MFDLRVLYAEDEEFVRNILSRILGKLVKELFVAKDGAEALELYKLHQPDIIITDIRMPKMSGFEMARAVREENRLIPIVAVTAHNDTEHFMEAIRLGISGFLIKPIETSELVKVLENIWQVVNLQKENIRKTKELEEALIKARLAEKAKGDFLAAMSHEIRTPLNAILGFTELLRDVDSKTLRDEYLAIIESSGKQLLSIINDILDYSKIESGSFELDMCEFNPKKEFEVVVDLFGAKAYEKRIKLLSFIDPRLPEKIVGDPLRVRQILSNLLSNALKFTPEEKNIFVNIVPIEEQEDRIKILFEVKDEGIGIQQDKLRSIFSPFLQAETGTARKYGGTGLGLSISSNLALLMDSMLRVESQVGVGSRFWFEIWFDLVEEKREIQKIEKKVFVLESAEHKEYSELLHRYLDAFGLDIVSREEADIVFVFELPKYENVNLGRKVLITDNLFLHEVDGVLGTIRTPLTASKILKALKIDSFALADEEAVVPTRQLFEFGGTKKVLVAEDNKINQKLITAMLKRYGIEAVLADDGEEAIKQFMIERYPLVFLDIQMPKVDGVEAMKALREIAPDTMLVALTAHANIGDRERFLELGFDDYLQKPLVESELLRVLGLRADRYSGETTKEKSDHIEELKKALGLDEEDILALLEDFVEESAMEFANISTAIDNLDLQTIFKLCHKIKGAAANMRIESVRAVAYEMEQNARAENLDFDYAKAFEKLQKEIAKIKRRGI